MRFSPERFRRYAQELSEAVDAMRFRITENTFFGQKERKVGDIMDYPVGPYKYIRASNGRMEPIAQFVELPEEVAAPVAEQTTQTVPPVVTMTSVAEAPAAPAAIAPAAKAVPSGSFAASIKAMLDDAKAGLAQARADGMAQVQEAVGKLNDAKVATTKVAGSMAKTIEDQAASAMSELGQISNDLGTDAS